MFGGRTDRELTNVRAKSSRRGGRSSEISHEKSGIRQPWSGARPAARLLRNCKAFGSHTSTKRYGRNESPRTDVPLAFMTKAEAVKQERATRQYSVRQTPNAIHPQPV